MERSSGGSDLNVEESPVSAALKRSLSLIWLGGSMSMSINFILFFYGGLELFYGDFKGFWVVFFWGVVLKL